MLRLRRGEGEKAKAEAQKCVREQVGACVCVCVRVSEMHECEQGQCGGGRAEMGCAAGGLRDGVATFPSTSVRYSDSCDVP